MKTFQEKQQFSQWWVYVLWIVPALLLCYAIVQQVFFGKPFGTTPASNIALFFGLMTICCIAILIHITALIAEVNEEGIQYRWSPFTKPRHYKWHDIANATVITYAFVGYGWRITTAYGMVHNVSGNKGLQIALKSGKKLLIGTRKPTELEVFLQSILAIRQRNSSGIIEG